MSKWYKRFGVVAMVGVLMLALASHVTFAQDGERGERGPGDRPGQQIGDGQRGPGNPLRGIIDRDVIKEVIAETLGLTVEDLDAAKEAGTTVDELAETQGVAIEDVQAAAKASAVAQVNQAVTDGEITQEEADRLIERINNSDFPLRNGRGHGPRGERGDGLRGIIDRDVIKEVIAETLGLTVEELDAAKEAGTTLEELAETQGVAIEDVQAAAKASAVAQVNQAVTDGEITQEEADRLIERINNSDFPLRNGRGHGPRGERGDGLRGIIDRDVIKEVIATTLGLTVEELDAAKEAGTTLEELAETQGVAIEDVQAAAKASAVAQVNQAVTDGEITQEEADRLIERINNSDFPLRGRGNHDDNNADTSDDSGDGTESTVNTDATRIEDGSSSAQSGAIAAVTVFLPVVTR